MIDANWHPWLIEPQKAARGHAMGHSMYIDSKILDVSKNSTNVQWTSMVVPGFMAICCHAKPLLAVSKA